MRGAPASVDGLAGIIGSLVDPRVGIVSSVEEVRQEAGGPNFFHYRAKACDTSAFARERNFRDGGGASTSRDVAMAKAVGEAVERYSAAIYDVEELPLFAYRDAARPCLAPESCALYTAEQYAQPGFPWVPFTAATTVRWVEGIDAHTREACWVPAARVFMPYNYYLGTGDAPIDQPISTGLAAHASWAAAACTAICEVVERDAVMTVWQAMLAPPQLRVETLSDANYDAMLRFERTGSSVTMFDLTLDHGIPTILSVLRGGSAGTPALVVAASSSLDPEEAVRKSLEELAHTRRYSQFIATHAPRLIPDPPAYESVTDQMTHLNFYCDHANAHHADFLFRSRKRVAFEEIANRSTATREGDVEELVRRIVATGERVALVDLTTEDVAALGLTVLRAIVPGFQPLHMGYGLRSLGGTRWREVPARLGYAPSGALADNPAPHPYP
jgi:ribosomal protein S12 methylthiotransferase accessory factor